MGANMRTILILAATAAFGVFGATVAGATTLAGTATGTFTGENAGEPSCGIFGCFGTDEAEISGDGKVLTWPAESCLFLCGPDPNKQSSLTIGDGPFSQDFPAGGGMIDLFTVTWYNESTPALPTPDNFQATADFMVSYTQPGAGGGSEMVTFDITNTDNPEGDEIIPTLAVGPLDFGGVPLDLGMGLTVVSYILTHSGNGAFADGLWTNPEKGTSVLTITAKIDVVPLPAAGWMLLAGVGGLAAYKRRRKAA